MSGRFYLLTFSRLPDFICSPLLDFKTLEIQYQLLSFVWRASKEPELDPSEPLLLLVPSE